MTVDTGALFPATVLVAQPPRLRKLIITHKSSAGHRGPATSAGKGELPSLAKEGWPRHQVNGPVPLLARPGMSGANVSPLGRNKEEWFVPLPIIGGLNLPPRLRPLRRLRSIFLMGAATPPFQGREFAFPSLLPGRASVQRGYSLRNPPPRPVPHSWRSMIPNIREVPCLRSR